MFCLNSWYFWNYIAKTSFSKAAKCATLVNIAIMWVSRVGNLPPARKKGDIWSVLLKWFTIDSRLDLNWPVWHTARGLFDAHRAVLCDGVRKSTSPPHHWYSSHAEQSKLRRRSSKTKKSNLNRTNRILTSGLNLHSTVQFPTNHQNNGDSSP